MNLEETKKESLLKLANIVFFSAKTMQPFDEKISNDLLDISEKILNKVDNMTVSPNLDLKELENLKKIIKGN